MISNLESLRHKIASKVLELHKGANAGHIGSSLSCLEILIYLYHQRVREQDLVVLSKGQAASALYVVLDSVGKLGIGLGEFYREGTSLSAHPPANAKVPAIPFATGSLGHGLSLACGLALSSKLSHEDRQVFCILSDGDCNAGSTWEALHFAAHHRLKNLTVIFDLNGLQGLGRADEIMNFEPIDEKLKLMGFEVSVARDGNSFQNLTAADQSMNENRNTRCLIARTTKGHGVSYMEDQMEWHYLPMNETQYKTAVDEQS